MIEQVFVPYSAQWKAAGCTRTTQAWASSRLESMDVCPMCSVQLKWFCVWAVTYIPLKGYVASFWTSSIDLWRTSLQRPLRQQDMSLDLGSVKRACSGFGILLNDLFTDRFATVHFPSRHQPNFLYCCYCSTQCDEGGLQGQYCCRKLGWESSHEYATQHTSSAAEPFAVTFGKY